MPSLHRYKQQEPDPALASSTHSMLCLDRSRPTEGMVNVQRSIGSHRMCEPFTLIRCQDVYSHNGAPAMLRVEKVEAERGTKLTHCGDLEGGVH